MSILSPAEALQKLKQGHNYFLKNTLKTLNINLDKQEIYNLKTGQNPYAIIITCSDSRIVPNLIFHASLSELFVIRTAGNVLDPLGIGSAEFGVEHLNIPLILVLGHEKCGAVEATIESVTSKIYPSNFQACVIDSIQPAVKKVLYYNSSISDTCCSNYNDTILENECIKANVKLTMSNLFRSKLIRDKIHNKKLELIGGFYDFDGHIDFFK